MESFWEKLGLEDNPYDSRALGTNKQDRKLFVGRNTELTRLNAIISGDKGGVILVEGGVGVGKTSFVNIFQYEKFLKEKNSSIFREN